MTLETASGQGVQISIERTGKDKFSLKLDSSVGILDWLIFPTQDYLDSKRGTFSGLPTGDGINCAKKLERTAEFSENAFPLRITLQSCREDENFKGWGRDEKTFGVTLDEPGELNFEARPGTKGFITPLLDEHIPKEVVDCVRNAPDGQAMVNDWQSWSANPNSLLRYGFTLETREVINTCAWQYIGENPFEQETEGLPSFPSQLEEELEGPIPELGNCNGEAECRTYCDQRDNPNIVRACIAFAKKHNLLSPEEIKRAEQFIDLAAKGGPGGCKNELECVTYCENVANIRECVAFAEKNNLLPPDELAKVKNISTALNAGAKLPGNCTGETSCKAYCENIDHLDECLAFAEKVELFSPQELDVLKKVTPFLKSGETPGGCKSKEQCEDYCAGGEYYEECVAFGEKTGVISEKEAVMIRKAKGKSPGNCRSSEECETYCANNFQECKVFAEEHGFTEILEENKEQFGKIKEDVMRQIKECSALDCKEMMACLQKFQTTASEELEPEAQVKLEACIQEMKQGQERPSGQYPQQQYSQYPQSQKIPQEYCSSFAAVPNCSYVGASDSDNYKYCKECFPDK